MNCKQKLKDIFLKCDIFSTSQFLRYSDEPEYRTLTGAFCSIVTVVAFTALFMNVTIGTFAKNQIIWSLDTVEIEADQFQAITTVQGKNKFMFAVSVDDIDMNNDTQRLFDIKFIMRTKVNSITSSRNQTEVPLEQCTSAHWNVNEQILRTYNRMNFSKMLCPPIGQKIPMQGKYTSQVFQYAQILVMKCVPKGNKTCANNNLLQNRTFHYNVYILNTLINPESPDYISYYLDDRNFIYFTTNFTSLVSIFVSKYQITTDQSITPVQQIRVQQGAAINQIGQVIPQQIDGDLYGTMVFRRSSTTIISNRGFKKIDETLSYIGGLFGFVLILLLFMKEYTQYSFQIDASSHLYYHDNQQPIHSHKFNFLIFLGYIFYLLLDALGFKPNWKTMEALDECRQEIQKQFDVRFLFQRINFLEKSLKHLFSDNQSQFLHLLRKPTLREASQLREKYRLKCVLMEQGGNNEQEMVQNPLQNISQETLGKNNRNICPNKVFPEVSEGSMENNSNTGQRQDDIITKMKTHYKLLHKDTSQGCHISKRIIEDLDPHIIKIIYEAQNEVESQRNDKNQQISLDKIKIEKSNPKKKKDKSSSRTSKKEFDKEQHNQNYNLDKTEGNFEFLN